MSLRLAPYNDAMRLGQGFNSYTHELCIDGAVRVQQRVVKKNAKGPANPSQVVSYSARCVEKLSDIVEAMNLSYSSSIKKGTIEISGNSTTVDENTFKLSDMNVVVSVRVVNQTIAIEDEATFMPLNSEDATAARFNDIYGDSYISGFIEGGDFSGIVSIKVIDRSNVSNVVNSIKASLLSTGNNNAKPEADEFTLGPPTTTGEDIVSSALGSALRDTQTTISINWMGGGQIKEPSRSWDIDSLYAAAAAFPASVAQCPQRTWAILTPYKANRSFVDWTLKHSLVKTLQYDLISSYTAELFDRFMDYKILLKRAQHILTNRKSYRQRIGVANAIGTEVATLLCLRAALRNEQTKIVEAIEVLGKDPSLLKRQAAWTHGHRSEVVRRIVEKALGESKDWQPVVTSTSSEVAQSSEATSEAAATLLGAVMPSATAETSAATTAEGAASNGGAPSNEAAAGSSNTLEARVEGGGANGDGAPLASGGSVPNAASVKQANTVQLAIPPEVEATTLLPPPPADSKNLTTATITTESTEFNFDTLIAPEVWEDLLPEPLEPITAVVAVTAPVTSVGALVGPGIGGLTSYTLTAPPPDDETGPASMVITTQSYADMEKDLKAIKATEARAQAELSTLKANQAALEQAARQAAERAAEFQRQATAAESARAQAASDLQAAQRTVGDLNAQLLADKTSSASRISTLERELATQTERAESRTEMLLREQSVREDAQRRIDALRTKIDNFKRWWDVFLAVPGTVGPATFDRGSIFRAYFPEVEGEVNKLVG